MSWSTALGTRLRAVSPVARSSVRVPLAPGGRAGPFEHLERGAKMSTRLVPATGASERLAEDELSPGPVERPRASTVPP